jgi:hypothetical protein
MKLILTLLAALPIMAFGQDSCKLKKETDPFTHQVKISTGFISFTNNGIPLSISVDATSTEIDFFLWFTGDAKCFDENSAIQINYEGDRMKANFKNTGSMNCEGAFHFSFRNTPGTPSNLLRITDKKIASFKITGPNKTITDVVLTGDQKNQLMRMAACVVRDAKGLIKQP